MTRDVSRITTVLQAVQRAANGAGQQSIIGGNPRHGTRSRSTRKILAILTIVLRLRVLSSRLTAHSELRAGKRNGHGQIC